MRPGQLLRFSLPSGGLHLVDGQLAGADLLLLGPAYKRRGLADSWSKVGQKGSGGGVKGGELGGLGAQSKQGACHAGEQAGVRAVKGWMGRAALWIRWRAGRGQGCTVDPVESRQGAGLHCGSGGGQAGGRAALWIRWLHPQTMRLRKARVQPCVPGCAMTRHVSHVHHLVRFSLPSIALVPQVMFQHALRHNPITFESILEAAACSGADAREGADTMAVETV